MLITCKERRRFREVEKIMDDSEVMVLVRYCDKKVTLCEGGKFFHILSFYLTTN